MAQRKDLTSGHAIVAEVARQYGLSPELICGPRRGALLMKARQYAIWRVRNECPHLGFPQIGRIFNRDHTTILAACRREDKRLEADHAAA